MGLFDKFKKRFSKSEDIEISKDEDESLESEEYTRKFNENNHNITEEVMDILLTEDNEIEATPSELVISEYDAGEADLLELENENLENNSTKNIVVHESFDDLEEPLDGVKIIGDISKEVTFDS
tara:strand:+ start:1646 stop:2017 length:372 start_codon:yes stop_codon:yes gene_type:complete